jgi:hypothetical protein
MKKPNFDALTEEIYQFEKKARFTKTPEKRLIEALKNEVKEHETSKSNLKKNKKLISIIVLCMQLARRRNCSLDKMWVRWWKKSEKYLGKNKNKYKKQFDEGRRH